MAASSSECGPSSAKTEALGMLDDAADEHLGEITVAGLLSWSKGCKPEKRGLLARQPQSLEQSVEALVRLGGMKSTLDVLATATPRAAHVDPIEWQTRPIPRLVRDAARARYRGGHSKAHGDFV